MLKIIPLLESVSDTEDDVKISSTDIIEEFMKDEAYKGFSKKLNDAASTLDSALTSFCATKYGKDSIDTDEFQDAKERLLDKIIKQYV